MTFVRPLRPSPASSRPATPPPAAPRRGEGTWTALLGAVLLVLGVAAWPLAAATPAPGTDAGAPAGTGMGAPHPPVVHAGGGPLHLATAAGPDDPAPPAAARPVAPPPPASRPAARPPRRPGRTRAQRFFCRRNLEGG